MSPKLSGPKVYLFRKPAEALLSFYNFNLQNEPEQAAEGPAAFCLARLPLWIEHVESYLRAADSGADDILFVSYEHLHEQAPLALHTIMSFIGIPVSPAVCEKAAGHHGFAQGNPREERGGYPPGSMLEEKADGAGAGLPQDIVDVINTQALPLYKQACSRETFAR